MRKKKEDVKNATHQTTTKTPKKPKRQKLPMKCAVCGSNSRFRYYNVQSCESCKQFFRRIVLKQKEFHCLKFWTCDFAKGERCRGCRLDKCLRLGMDPSMVNIEMTDMLKDFIEKLEQRRRKIMDPHYSKLKFNEPGSIEEEQNSLSADEEELNDEEEGREEIVLVAMQETQQQGQSTSSQNGRRNSPPIARENIMSATNPGSSEQQMMDCSIATTSSSPLTVNTQPADEWNGTMSTMGMMDAGQKQMPIDLIDIPQNFLSSWAGEQHSLPHNQFQSLLQIEEKIRKIHFSSTEMSPNYFDNFNGIGQLMLRMDNLLANSGHFSAQPTSHWIRSIILDNIQRQGIFAKKPVYYIRDLVLVIDFARTIPVYNQLSLEDQISLVSSFSLSASRMMISFYSVQRNSHTMLLPNGMPIMEQFKVDRFARAQDPILDKLCKKVYNFPVAAFHKIRPNKEEFIMLLTLLFLNSATSGISGHAQQLLKDEADKCGKLLLRMQQTQLGAQAGALRYMETMSLLWDCIGNAHKYRELLVYLDAVYERGQFSRVMPKMLVPLCMQGPRELPNLPGPF